MLFAGIDVSTQGCKLVVIDLDTADTVWVDTLSYDADLPAYGTRDGVIRGLPPGVSESDPRMWVEAIETVLGRLAASPVPQDEIRALALSGQQHGLVAVDASGGLSRPTAKLWNDFSTAGECEALTDAVGGLDAMIAEVGNSQRPGYTAGKILHMVRHEPDAWARTDTLFVVKDYLNFVLTGVRRLEPGDTSGMALWNPESGEWSGRVLDAIAPDLGSKLPPVGRSDASLGTVRPEIAERFGLSPSCVVAPGSGDNMCAAVGTGNVRPGLVTVSLGTSGTACTVLDEAFVDPLGEIAAYRDATGRHLSLLCVSNLANGYNELLRLHGISHGEFEAALGATPPGNDGRVLIPWYAGERTPDVPFGAPLYFGFELDGFGLAPLARAVLEGHVLNLEAGFERMPIRPTELRLTGGLTRSDAWCQAIADVFDAEAVPVEGEGAALGAALTAAWVWLGENGRARPIEDVVDPFVRLAETRRARPRPEHRDVYRRQRAVFRALSRRVRGLEGADPFAIRHGPSLS